MDSGAAQPSPSVQELKAERLQAIRAAKAQAKQFPEDLDVLKRLAAILWEDQRFDEAEETLQRMIAIDGENPWVWNSLAICQDLLGDADDALKSFKRAAELGPKFEPILLNLGKAYERRGDPLSALEAYEKVLAVNMQSYDALVARVDIYHKLGNVSAAVDDLSLVKKLRGLPLASMLTMAEGLRILERLDEAEELAKAIRSQYGESVSVYFILGMIKAQKGDHEGAAEEFEKALAIDPRSTSTYYALTQARKFTEEDRPRILKIEEVCKAEGLDEKQRSLGYFALGSIYNDLKDYESSFKAYDEGNRLALQTIPPYDIDEQRRYTQHLCELYSPATLNRYKGFGNPDERPIFVVGMPRSGTTLTETILASHSQVVAGGELTFWRFEAPMVVRHDTGRIEVEKAHDAAARYLVRLSEISSTARKVTDKFPANYLHIGLLHILYPNARFINCIRNPADTCISIWMSHFGIAPKFAHSKKSIVAAYRYYAYLMSHWRHVMPADRLMNLHYEELIADQETWTRKLIAFCGLKWEDGCLHPEESDRVISTMSHRQARQKVYNTSVERWRRYEPWIGEFRELLDRPPEF